MLIHTVPASSRRLTACALETSDVHNPAASPNRVSLASAMASSSLSNGMTARIGPNFHARLSWGTVEALDIDEFADIVRFNLVGPIASTRAFLELLKRAHSASVIHLGSVDGLFGNPVAVAYSVSKAGLGPMTLITAREFAVYGVRVNAVASAQTSQVTATEVEDGTYRNPVISLPNFPGGRYMRTSRATPLKRWGPPEQWAGTVSFLASDDAAYVTGAVVVVDCGRTGLTPGTFPWDSPSTT